MKIDKVMNNNVVSSIDEDDPEIKRDLTRSSDGTI